jgi:phthalate 4,5-cis-dihydrodiol dehydrogenase
MIRLGIVGLGVSGQRHLSSLPRVSRSDVRLTAVATARPARLSGLQLPADVAVFNDYRTLIRDGQVDAVIIALPPNMHKEAAVYAAQHGKHVLLEKPIATTLAEGEQIAQAAETHNVRLMLGYVHRYREEIIAARELLAAGRIGKPTSILDRFVLPGDDLPNWVWDREISGGGVMMHAGVHAIDRLRWLMGCEVVEVYARVQTYGARPGVINIENGLATMLTFENGVIATLIENMPPYDVQYRYWDTEIFGTAGMLHIRTDDYLEFTGPSVNFKQTFRGYDRHARQIDAFVDAIVDARTPDISAEDGMRSLAIALAIYRSAYVGRPVLVTNHD